MSNKTKRFIRWQQRMIDQFTNLLNTMLLIISAFFGFLVSFKTNSSLNSGCLLLFLIILTAAILIILVFISYNRLKDFRFTLQKIRKNNVASETIEEIGKLSWNLLHAVLFLVIIDILLFILFIILNFS